MSYSQFIHGKFVGGRNYRVVALTPDLVGQEAELESLAQRYRFWGQQPPGNNPIAVGVFQHAEGLLLAQAMSATHSDGRPALDGQNRPFSQHRYILLPPDALHQVAGRLWLLLNWVMQETRGIPLFERLNTTLHAINPPNFQGLTLTPEAELDKLKRSLQLLDERGQPLLLATLAALLNGKRVVFDAANTGEVYSEDLLEGALLLLPAVCRPQVSIAAGALDESICTQAALMVKTNGTPARPMAADLLWAKRANNHFFGETGPHTFRSDYTTLLQPILAQPDSLNILFPLLETITDPPPAGKTPMAGLHNGWLATRLIPALPDPAERANYWRSALKDLTPAEWRNIIPSLIDDVALEVAWTTLQGAVKQEPSRYAPLIFLLWQNVSEAYLTYALRQELPADISLAESLLRHGLLAALGAPYREAVLALAQVVIARRAEQNRAQALTFARAFIEAEAESITEPRTRLSLLEASLPPQPATSDLFSFFTADLAPLLPQLTPSDLEALVTYRHLSRLDPDTAEQVADLVAQPKQPQEALLKLPEIATATEMGVASAARFYAACLAEWQPAFQAAQPLLADLATRWIAEYRPAERPPLAEILVPLSGWLAAHAPAAVNALLLEEMEALEATDAVAGREVGDWLVLAQHFFVDPLAQVSFLDHVTAGQPSHAICRQWLVVLAEDQTGLPNFEASYAWHALRADGPPWLVDGLSQLLGWQETSMAALLPLLERIQEALDLPQTSLFQLLAQLPGSGEGGLGMLLAAALPGLLTEDQSAVESLPLWQMLNAQYPKVAQVYKVLAEGAKNLAVDLFNQRKLSAALIEAPGYAEVMAHWLRFAGKGDWVRGQLLETIVEGWVQTPAQIDPTLLGWLFQPALSAQYAPADWLALARIGWQPDFLTCWPAAGQPDLNSRQQAQALSLAREQLSTYSHVSQTELLLSACRQWGFSQTDLADLAGHIPPQACNFQLLNTYLYLNGTIRNPNDAIAQNLLALAIRLTPQDTIEQGQYKTLLTQLACRQLQAADGPTFLTNWYHLAADQGCYREAVADAVLQLAPQHFSQLVAVSRQLKSQNHPLSQTLTTALDTYWQHEKHLLTR